MPPADLGQCQALTSCGHISDKPAVGERCEFTAVVADPRGPHFCWVHHKAFNNPVRATPLHLHKSVTE